MEREFRREKYSGVESNRENKITFRSCDIVTAVEHSYF